MIAAVLVLAFVLLVALGLRAIRDHGPADPQPLHGHTWRGDDGD